MKVDRNLITLMLPKRHQTTRQLRVSYKPKHRTNLINLHGKYARQMGLKQHMNKYLRMRMMNRFSKYKKMEDYE